MRRATGGAVWAVPAVALNYVRPTTTTVFELEALEGLPCGCVAAAYRARPWDVAVVSLEAKGPHCILTGHASGQILRLGDPDRSSTTRRRTSRGGSTVALLAPSSPLFRFLTRFPHQHN